MSIIIFGPQGCGKTRNVAELAAHFGMTRVVEDWTPGDALPDDALALTNFPGVEGVIDFEEAMRLLNGP